MGKKNSIAYGGTAVLIVALLSGCSSEEEGTSDAITRIAYEQAMEFVSDTVSETSCEVYYESPDTFSAGFLDTFLGIEVPETGQTYGDVISEDEAYRDLEREMREACEGR